MKDDVEVEVAGAVEDLPRLTGRREPWLDAVLAQPDRLARVVDDHGSPVHLLAAAPFERNHAALRAAATDRGVDVLVLYARKANRARAFVAAALASGAGVDTASLRELEESIALGATGDRLVVTGAVKPDPLLALALDVGATVVVDNVDEAAALRRLAPDAAQPPVVALRVSGFLHDGRRRYSRFGVDLADARAFVRDHLGGALAPAGLHFHLDGYSRTERGDALHQTLDLAEALAEDGVGIDSIDIGGGLRVSYLDDEREWARFHAELRRAVAGQRSPLTVGGDGLGLRVEDGEVVGAPAVYPFHEPRPGPLFLVDVLDHVDERGRSAASRLRGAAIQLRLEPGRALLDGAGATVARVVHRKRDARGDLLVGLEMNGTQHGSSSADILVDPLLVPIGDEDGRPAGPVAAVLTGNYCTEGDLLLRRRVPLPVAPAIGDLLVFVNTAGYFMHFRATDGHRVGPATDLVVEHADGRWEATADERWAARHATAAAPARSRTH